MNTTRNFEENLTEMVFENKNKAYGAYAIRKAYHDNVTFSLILSSAFFGLLALLAVSFTNRTVEIPDTETGNKTPIISSIVEVFIQPKDPNPKPIEKPKETPKTESGVKEASDTPQKSDGKINENQNFSKNPNPFGMDSVAPKDPEIKKPEIIETGKVETFVDKMPEMDNMRQFIVDNLVYPRIAVENGTTGVVGVTFVVEVDGSITDIKLMNSIGDGCEQEAKRVVSIMPKWHPGINKGKPVRVQCNLPIKFRLK